MSLPHRIAACFCILGKESSPKDARQPGHKFNPSDKTHSNAGFSNPGDDTAVQENYGGGANSYFTAYPTYLITPAKGSNIGNGTDCPAIEITLRPYRNFWSCNVIDARSEIASYMAADPDNLSDPTDLYNNTAGAGKGEFVEQTWTVYFDDVPPDHCDTTEEELKVKPKTIIRPLDFDEDQAVYFDDLKFFPTEQFQPWRWGYYPGWITQGAMLCSMTARNIHCDLLGVKAVSTEAGGYYADLKWQPQAENADGIFYSNTCTWQLKVKADLCCWNEGFKIKGRVMIAKVELDRVIRSAPYYNTQPDLFYNWHNFQGDIFKLMDGAEPAPFEEVPWEVTIDDTTADGTLKVAADIQIPQEIAGTVRALYFINGFIIDEVIPPAGE